MVLQAAQQASSNPSAAGIGVNEAIVNVLPPPRVRTTMLGADHTLFQGHHRHHRHHHHYRHLQENNTNATWTQRGNGILGLETGNQAGGAIALSHHGTFLAISERFHEPDEDPNTYDHGLTRVFEFNGLEMSWRQRGNGIKAASNIAGDDEGKSMALSADGSILAIGSTKSENQEGMARVFHWDGSLWVEQGGGFPGPYAGSHKGYSIALSEDGHTIATGSPDIESGGKGWFLIYERNGVGAAWSPRGSATYGINNGDEFGAAISLSSDGNVIAVGAPRYNGDTGQVAVYKWTSHWFLGSSWDQHGSPIVGTASAEGRRVGEFIDLSADASVIAVSETNLCHVYEWTNNTSWQPRGSAIDVQTDVISSVAISSDGNVVALGLSPADNAARIFEWDGASWSQRMATIRHRRRRGNESGPNSVALSYDGNIIAVVTRMHDLDRGLVQVFSEETLPGETSAWNITFIDSKVDFSHESTDELIMSFNVSKFRPIRSNLYHHDCTTEITDIEINRTMFNIPMENLQDFLTLNYSIDKSGIKSSSIWNALENRIELCQIVQLINSTEGEDMFTVLSQDKRKLMINFDPTVNFLNGITLERATVSEADYIPEEWSEGGCPSAFVAGGNNYDAGAIVSVDKGSYSLVYQCQEAPLNLFCGMSDYEPGIGQYWSNAWTELGSCSGLLASFDVLEGSMGPTESPSFDVLENMGACPDEWEPRTEPNIYDEGDTIAVNNIVFSCRAWPYSFNCGRAGFMPTNSDASTPDVWKQAWIVRGYCECSTESPNFDVLDEVEGGCPDEWSASNVANYNYGNQVSVTVSDDPDLKVVYECKQWPAGHHCVKAGQSAPGQEHGWVGWIFKGHCFGTKMPTPLPTV